MQNMRLHFIVFLLGVPAIYAQTYDQLLTKKDDLIEESRAITRTLEETQSIQNNTIEQLSIVNEKISIQEKILELLEEELIVLVDAQKSIENELAETQKSLQSLKQQYSILIKQAHHISRSYNRILFFLSSNSFNQLARRMYHLQKIEQNARHYFEQINQMQLIIEERKKQIINKKILQRDVSFEKQNELVLLSQSKIAKQNSVNFLKNKQDSLRDVLFVKQAETKKIEEEIILILEKQKNNQDITPELTLISKNFFENKGRLPWPVNKGSLVSKFGEVPHPILSGITTMNNGIEIATNDKYVRSVFDGEVTKIIILPNGLKVVIIRHGTYLTVYSNLLDLNVFKGDRVKTKQTIGVLYENEKTERNLIGFQIWNNRNKLNPTQWLTSY